MHQVFLLNQFHYLGSESAYMTHRLRVTIRTRSGRQIFVDALNPAIYGDGTPFMQVVEETKREHSVMLDHKMALRQWGPCVMAFWMYSDESYDELTFLENQARQTEDLPDFDEILTVTGYSMTDPVSGMSSYWPIYRSPNPEQNKASVVNLALARLSEEGFSQIRTDWNMAPVPGNPDRLNSVRIGGTLDEPYPEFTGRAVVPGTGPFTSWLLSFGGKAFNNEQPIVPGEGRLLPW